MAPGVMGSGFIHKQTSDIQNQLLIKERNLRRLFDLIYAHKEISRATLATMTKLSPTTVSSLIDELLSCEVVLTSGVETSGKIGRKAILLQVNPNRMQIPTIAWEKDGFRYVLYDLLCNELETIFLPLSKTSDYAEELHQLIVRKSKKVVQERVGALCISIPAVLDVNSHRIISTVLDVQGHEDFLVQVKKQFQARPVIIGNESAFYAYAEKEFSLSTRAENVIYINVNVGVGAGIIYRGKIYRGSFGMAGEFGHMSVDMHGPLCTCGNRGCIERLISTPRIIERVVEAVRQGGASLVTECCEGDLAGVTLPMIAQAFKEGDSLVDKVIQEVAHVLSFGITNVIRIFDPEILVIGGGIEILGPRFLEMVKDGVNQNGSILLASTVEIIYTKLPPSCKNRGAAKYYIDNIMRFTVRKTEDVIIC
jgi:predicted NBD/HSP70 family sugar kinase